MAKKKKLPSLSRSIEAGVEEGQPLERAIRSPGNEEIFRLIAENTADVVWIFDLAAERLKYVSPSAERQSGYSVAELMERRFQDFFTPDSFRLISSELAARLSIPMGSFESAVRIWELDQPHKNGSIVHTEMVTTLLADEQGIPTHVVGVTRDVTERKRMQEKLAASEARLRKTQEELERKVKERTAELSEANARLQESESKYRTLVESMQDGVFVVQDGMIRYVNPFMARILGYEIQEMQGLSIFSIVAPEDRDWVLERYRDRMSGKDVESRYELKALHRDGRTRIYVRISLALIEYEGKTALLGTARDITEQKRAESSLRESEEKFRRITENMRDMVCQLDDTGRISYASPSHLHVLGYDPADLIGKSTIGAIHPDDVAPMLASFRASLESGNPMDVSLRCKHALGHYVWLQSSGSFLFDGEGKITGAVISSRDITKRKMAEHALRESEARFRSLAESTSDWIWETDAEGRYTYVSPNVEQLLGLKPEEFIGRRPFQFMALEEAKRLSNFLRVVKDAEKPFSGVEKIHLHKDGHRVIFEACGIPILDSDGGLLGYRGIDRDVTQRKALEAQAIRVRHLSSIGELAAGVAHEINNPVTGIINYAQILTDEADETGSEAEIPRRIIKEGERIARIVKNLLSFAREGNTDKEPIQILPALEDAITLMATLFRKEGIAVKVDIPEGMPMIVANRKDLQQVFLNILANSRYALNKKYMGFHEEKVIRITMEENGSGEMSLVRMIFYDHGIGISPEVLSRIFDPFFSTKPPDQAMGLGLSISYGILKDHRGNIDVESKEGEYTQVMLEFPAEA